MQHYSLGRDIEIAVIDGQRRLGNGYCLPAGPLREPKNKLLNIDLIVSKYTSQASEYKMEYIYQFLVHPLLPPPLLLLLLNIRINPNFPYDSIQMT